MLSNVMATALSGLNAASRHLDVSANNTANQLTPAYQAQQVTQTASAQGGVQAAVAPKDPATIPVADADGNITQAPNVDAAEEVVQQQIASYDFKANLRVLRAADEMSRQLVDIRV